jgi:cell fate (sporulation/competence/biofilm development) regulator YlbF (YheA/YmcA/DUF963 family)
MTNPQCTTYFNCTCTDCVEYRTRLDEYRKDFDKRFNAQLQTQQTQEMPMITTDTELQATQEQNRELNVLESLGAFVRGIIKEELHKFYEEVTGIVTEMVEGNSAELRDDMKEAVVNEVNEVIGNSTMDDFYDFDDAVMNIFESIDIEDKITSIIEGMDLKVVVG